jgi:hypothetical protein
MPSLHTQSGPNQRTQVHYQNFMQSYQAETYYQLAPFLPKKVREQFYIKLTFGRALACLAYAATLLVLRLDHDQVVLNAIFGNWNAPAVAEVEHVGESAAEVAALDAHKPATHPAPIHSASLQPQANLNRKAVSHPKAPARKNYASAKQYSAPAVSRTSASTKTNPGLSPRVKNKVKYRSR